MDALKQLISIASALIGLASVVIGYKALVKKHAGASPPSLRALRVVNPAVRIRPWNMRRVRWLFLLPAAVNIVIALVLFRTSGAVVLNIVVGAFLLAVLMLARVEPPSRTIKRSEYVLEGTPKGALEDSLSALAGLGAKVGYFDADEGVIEASTSVNWRSFGEILTVRVSQIAEGRIRMEVQSDVFQPSVLFDFGANARNLRRFQAGLLQSSSLPTDGGA
jgi:hypothetical protein